MTKQELRLSIQTQIQSMSAHDIASRSNQIWSTFFHTDLWQQATSILGYCALCDEVCTKRLFEEVAKSGKEFFLPTTSSEHLVFFKSAPDQAMLSKHSLGFLQPTHHTEMYDPRKHPHALLIAPALAATTHGYRLGRGGGFYDRFLANNSFAGTTVVVIFSHFLQKFATQAHDQAFDYVLSENGLFKAYPETCYNAH